MFVNYRARLLLLYESWHAASEAGSLLQVRAICDNTCMKKLLFGIFAHPDDEAFGPSGTLLTEARSGTEVHLVTLTYGNAGANPDQHADLSAVREHEWRQAGKLIGAADMHAFGYRDGTLCNTDLLAIGQRLVDFVTAISARHSEPLEIEFMSMDLNGITGHIDHIVAARAACWAFYTLKQHDARFTRIRLACAPRDWVSQPNTDWLYMEAGRAPEEIDEIVDAGHYYDELIAIIRTHHSQRGDGEAHIAARGRAIGLNYFMVRT